ncbi:unnamed protein product [Withania somnifera]
MGVARDKLSIYWWRSNTDQNCTQNRSPWLQSTLDELDEKTEAILRIIEEDADTFAQRAEIYLKKRPELVNILGEIYRSHQLLAEGYDQIKSASRTHILASRKSALPFTKYSEEKLISYMEKSYDSYSESFDPESESSDLSEIEDLDNKEETQIQAEKTKTEATSGLSLKTDEVLKLNEEFEQLKEENREKREAIRQLCLAWDLLRKENSRLRMNVTKASWERENFIELKASKKGFLKRLFSRSSKC